MSFTFPSWDKAFSESFHSSAKATLEAALNKGNKPPVIQGRIEVVELSMGKEPPTLTLLEIGDLSLDRFRGIFRLGYSGDAWLEVKCRVQANPLSHNPHLSLSSGLPISTPLLASQPLLVPMTLRLSHLHLRAILILVVSASKGITLVFKNDPLQNVEVSSTFDSIEVIRGYLQQEIEGQLREMFREDLPGIIHRLSQKWFTDTGMGGKVELPYRADGAVSGDDEEAATPSGDRGDIDPFDTDPDADREIFPPYHRPSQMQPDGEATSSPSRTRKLSKPSSARKLSNSMVSDSPTSYTTFPEIEEYDPTYGMRPEGLPTHSGYEAFGRLWDKARDGKNKGLGSLMTLAENTPFGRPEEEHDPDLDELDEPDGNDDVSDTEDGRRSFDMVDMAIALPEPSRPAHSLGRSTLSVRSQSTRSITPSMSEGLEWETIPAVGGGTVSRPRIFHVQSQIRAPSEAGFGAGGIMPSPSGTAGTATGGSVTARASSVRSSIGGSTLGLGVARSRITEQPQRDSYRHQAFARLSGISKAHVPSAGDRSDGDVKSRPVPRRQHSRGESVPAYAASSQYTSSRLRSSYVGSQNRTSTSSMDSLAGPSRGTTYTTATTSQAPPSRPVSMAAYPGAKNITPPRPRRLSATFQPFQSGSPPFPGSSYPPKLNNIILPLNDSVSQLATLSHSNHTLSPYARSHEHVAVRSFPRLSRLNSMALPGSPLATSQIGAANIGPDARLVRAKRKRMFKLGGTKKASGAGGDVFTEKPRQLGDLSRRSSESSEAYVQPSLGQAAQEIHAPRPKAGLTSASGRPYLPSRTSYGFPRTAQ